MPSRNISQNGPGSESEDALRAEVALIPARSIAKVSAESDNLAESCGRLSSSKGALVDGEYHDVGWARRRDLMGRYVYETAVDGFMAVGIAENGA